LTADIIPGLSARKKGSPATVSPTKRYDGSSSSAPTRA
jgi:hypothetical protein